MKRFLSRVFLSFFLSACVVPGAWAVPARGLPQKMEQPDGTSITVSLCGDEFFSYFLTDDGLMADRDTSGVFRLIGNDGRLTDIPVVNSSERTSEYNARIRDIEPSRAFAARSAAAAAASPFKDYREDRNATFKARLKKLSDSKWDNEDGHDIRAFPTEGEQKVLVILVAFPDAPWTFSNDPKSEMNAILNQPGYNSDRFTGSAYDFFYESSNGVFRPQFDVFGPVTVSKSVEYYGERLNSTSDLHVAELVLEACQMLDDEINFADYDRDGDEVVDNVYMFFAGPGENEGAETWRIWPHAWDVRHSSEPILRLDGVQIGHYACSNEVIYRTNRMAGIGTMCHEFSHVLGLPDLYATEYTGAQTPGSFSCMDQGPYNNDGRTPPLFSGYERYAVEWQKPIDITSGEQITMLPLSLHGHVYRMTLDHERPTEYFLFENRQQEGFDSFIPHHGMLVWHINFDKNKWTSNKVNNTPTDQHVDIVEADGSGDESSREGDTFPGAEGITSFTADGEPAFANIDGTRSQLGLTDITESADGTVSFKVGNGRDENSSLLADTPELKITEAGPDYIVIGSEEMPAEAEHNNLFMVSVSTTTYDEDADRFTTDLLPGYESLTFDGEATMTVSGLQPKVPYTVSVYRMGEYNVSDPQRLIATVGGEDVSGSRPEIFGGEDNRFSWTKINGADKYLLTVAKRRYTDSEVKVVGTFDNRRNPSGWESLGTFSSAEGTFGTSAPSFCFAENDEYIWTKDFGNHNITKLSMWAATNVTVGTATLHLYSTDSEGALAHISSLPVPKEGETITFDNLPQGVTRFVLLATVPAGKKVFVDDITIETLDILKDEPVEGYEDKEITDTFAEVNEGVIAGETYVAFVKAASGSAVGKASNALEFVSAKGSKVDTIQGDNPGFKVANGMVIPSDASTPYSLYMLDGRVVATDVKGAYQLPEHGVYLLLMASKIFKVIY